MLFSSLLVACEPSHNVIIKNETKTDLVIFVGQTRIAELRPGEQVIRQFSAPVPKWLITAKDQYGKIIYSREWTPNDLGASNWKVVITSS